MSSANETVYIKAEQNIEVIKPEVTLGDVLQLECPNSTIRKKIEKIKLLQFQEKQKEKNKSESRCVVSVLKVIQCIHKVYPSLEIQNVGEADFIVTYEEQHTKGKFIHGIKVVSVVLITFIGAAFSIMSFNNDVDTTKLFGQVYELLVGQKSDGFTILEFSYCIGLIIGILVFFNHFGKKRFSVDPTPMEVEMRLYENDIQTTLIESYSRKEKELDVGDSSSSGNYRT